MALGVATVVAVPVAAVMLAAKLTVTATANARTRLAIAAPMAPVLVAAVDPDEPPTGSVASRGFALASADHTVIPRTNSGARTSVISKTMPAEVKVASLATGSVFDRVSDWGWPARQHGEPLPAPPMTAVVALPLKREGEDKVPLPPARPKLAYAKPDLDVLPSVPAPLSIAPGPARTARDARTAVYDIEASTVFLPSGRKLEAHSGLGDLMDDPRYVRKKNRGPTPPNTYDLTLRESLFHGVRAIRMNPVDEDAMFNRDGILAHSYMLGPNGQSNGCISFKNYPEFLQAFLKGEVDRIVVVPRAGSERFAQLHGRPAGKFAVGSRQ